MDAGKFALECCQHRLRSMFGKTPFPQWRLTFPRLSTVCRVLLTTFLFYIFLMAGILAGVRGESTAYLPLSTRYHVFFPVPVAGSWGICTPAPATLGFIHYCWREGEQRGPPVFEIAFSLILPSYKAMECTYSSLSPRFGAANVHLKAYQYAIIFFACAVRVFSCFRWRCYSDPPPTQRHVRQRLVSTANLGTYWPRNCGKYRKQGNHETPDASFELPGMK